MFYVYVVYNKKHNKFYIGQTVDIFMRLEVHNKKLFKSSYTSRFDGGWELVYKEICKNRVDALIREKQLKSGYGRAIVKRIIKEYLNKNSRTLR